MANTYNLTLQKILEKYAAGTNIEFNGDKPFDPQIHDNSFYAMVVRHGSIGLGEAYMQKKWDCANLDEFFSVLLTKDCKNISNSTKSKTSKIKDWLLPKIMNLQSAKRSYIVGEQHYDIGNDLYTLMLDETMAYSCGYWRNATNLHQAQVAKLELICQKLKLKPNSHILEIGCGWGSFAEHAARLHKAKVTGITISKEQQKLAQERCKNLDVTIILEDYRSLTEHYDNIVSIGMFEHVGHKNYKTYFEVAHRLIADDGIFLLHTIGNNNNTSGTDPWINKYIFPNGEIPSLEQISAACNDYFVIEDVHNFGMDYDKTLMAWFENFHNNWDKLKGSKYDETFYRMWEYYLKSCAGAFRSRNLQLFQIVLRKKNQRLTPYNSIR